MHNKDRMNMIFHFSTNIICFFILSGYSILGDQELVLINSTHLYTLNWSSLVGVGLPVEIYTSQVWNFTLIGDPIVVQYWVKQYVQ